MILINRERRILVDTAGGTILYVSPEGKMVAERLPEKYNPVDEFPVLFDGFTNVESGKMLERIASMASLGISVVDTTSLHGEEVFELTDFKE